MRTTTAYFAGVGTVVAAVAVGLGSGLLISNIVSPHEPRTEMSKLELRMSSKPIPVSNAPAEPVPYLAATGPDAAGPLTAPAPAQDKPQTAPANTASTPAPVADAQTATNAPPAAPPPAAPVTQAATSEQVKSPENAFARASDTDIRREARRAEDRRRAERRQQWTERRRYQPRDQELRSRDQELREVEEKVRDETEARRAFGPEPVQLEMPRIQLFGDE